MGKCQFKFSWINTYDWLECDKSDIYAARCKACRKTFSIKSGGKGHIDSHATGSDHIREYTKWKMLAVDSKKMFHRDAVSMDNISDTPTVCEEMNSSNTSDLVPKTVSITSTGNEEMRAEIIWCLKCVLSNYSFSSNVGMNDIFTLMFPDSDIAAKFHCEKNKIAYSCKYGIAPYFKQQLIDELNNLIDPFVVMFDESLNAITQTKQMDVMIRYYDTTLNIVKTRYLDSQFMGHGDSDRLLVHMISSLKNIVNKKMIIGRYSVS